MTFLRDRLTSWPVLAGAVVLVVLAIVAGPALARAVGLAGEALTPTDKRFATVCRDHGGTPTFAPGSGDYVKDARDCTVEYGGDDYEMYAVHPEGFSLREAEGARRACVLLARQKRIDAGKDAVAAGSTRVVWHPRSGICESTP